MLCFVEKLHELTEKMVVLGHGALAFEHLDGDGVLVVGSSGEDLRLLGGNNSVTRNEFGHDSTDGLNAHGKRVNVEEHDLASVLLAGQNSSLDSSTISDGLIGVDTTARFLAVEEFLDELLDLGNTGAATDKNDLVDIGFLHVSILHNLLDGLHRRAEEIHVQLLELGTGKSLREVITFIEAFDFNPDL